MSKVAMARHSTQMHRRKWVGVGMAGVALLLAVVGGTAGACTHLASLNVSATAARPGDAIVVTGSGFSGGVEGPMDGMDMAAMDMGGMDSSSLAARSPVTIRWDSPDGTVLTSAIPDRTGSISATITVPEALPGHYTLVAVQKNVQGYDVYGTPARAILQVTGDAAADRDRSPTPIVGAGDGGSSGALVLTVILGVASLSLLLGAAYAAPRVGARRRVAVPA